MNYKYRIQLSILLLTFTASFLFSSPADDAKSIIKMKNLRKPGLCVHVGSTDGEIEVEIAKTGVYLVEGICFDTTKTNSLLPVFYSKGVPGKATVVHVSGKKLPYPDNYINLIIADNYDLAVKNGINSDELIRVLAPYGSLLSKTKISIQGMKKSGSWYRYDKPFPSEMDHWRQSRYDPARTAVSKDKLVGPPNSLRWVGGERWTNESSWGASQLLAADGRVIFRQGIETGYGFRNRKKGWHLSARDGFNGTLLWTRDIFPEKYNRMSFPMLLAEGKVYIQNLILDAATGEEIKGKSLIGKGYYAPIAYMDGYYLQLFGSKAGVINAKTGKQLWESDGGYIRGAATDGKIVYQEQQIRDKDGTKKRILVARDFKTGKQLWKNDNCDGSLFCCRDELVLTSGNKGKEKGWNTAYSSKDGSQLWKYEYDLPGHGGRPYVFFLGGLAWVHVGDNAQKYPKGEAWHGINPKTGNVDRKIPMDKKVKHRCYPHRATEKYILGGGIDLFDHAKGAVSSFHGIRGGCSTGYIPANGTLYGMPTVCECFAHVRGFPAVAEAAIPSWKEMKLLAGNRLDKGNGSGKPGSQSPDQWNSYRHDSMLSGATPAAVPSALTPKWERKFKNLISAPVVSGKTVIVSEVDSNTITALDTSSGKTIWQFYAGGRTATPPTITGTAVLFGAADGWLYSVSLSKGDLIWKFRAAPMEKRILSRGRIESSWTMFGSVPVHGGNVFAAAGRHDEMDGGIFLSCLNAVTGKVKWERQIQRAELLKQVSPRDIDNEMNDILRTDGKTIFMYDKSFSALTGEPVEPSGYFLWGGTAGWLDDLTKPPYTWKHDFQRARQLRDKNGRGNLGSLINMEGRTTFVVYSDKYEIFRREGRSKTVWTYKYKAPQCPRSMAVTHNAVFIPAMQDVDDSTKGEIWVLDKAKGTLTKTIPLPSAPAFEGIAAVTGFLFITTEDGRLLCLGR